MKKKVVLSILTLVLLLLVVTGIGLNPTVTALPLSPEPTINIDPPSIDRLVGESFTVDIRIRDVEEASHIVAWNFILSYNTALLDVSATQEGPFLSEAAQLQPGSAGTTYAEIIEEAIGKITLGCIILPNETGDWNPPWPSDSGVLANVTFDCTGPGICVLDLEPFFGTLLLDENGNPIPGNVEDGYVIQEMPIHVDIKPGSWPNPINVRNRGVFAVAICGTEKFDVTSIDPVTVTLDGVVVPLRWSWEDAATPYMDDTDGGHDLEGDGYLDLVLLFDTQEAAEVLTWRGNVGETLPVIIKGNLFEEYDGSPIQGEDFVWILG